MIENNRNNEQIYGRNDMIMLDPNNKIYGSLGIADNYVMKTEEGTRLILSNPKQGRFGDVLTEFNMYGRSEQKQYSGKNLLKIRDGVQTERGITVIAKDGVVALKGTATATGWTTLKTDSFILNGTYILSSNLTEVTVRLANKSYKAVISQNESKTLENEEVSVLCFVVKEGKTYDISNILVQIEKGSEATSYEPYVGGKPSPSPDYPQEIKSVVNPIVKVTNEDGTQFETVTLPYTLNAIPVQSGGNVTIDSQQWVCDEIDLKRGVKVQRVYKVDVDGENIKFIQSDRYANISAGGLPIALYDNGQRIYGISTFTSSPWFYNKVSGQFLYLVAPDISDQINESCKKQIGKIYYALETPIETALTPAEISAYKALSTKTPTTIIENNYNTWMKATYKSTESV